MQPIKPILARSKILLLALAAILAGCGKKEIYEKIYEKPHRPLACLHIEANDDIARFLLLKNLYLKKMQKEHCPFELKATAHFVKSCTSAQAKALGSDFDGFLRLELYENGKLLYRNQRDFKGALNDTVVKSLVEKVKRFGVQSR